MSLHVAVDIGGTFTDLIGYDESTGQVYQSKSSSTPQVLTQGIMRCLEKSGLEIDRLANFVHAPLYRQAVQLRDGQGQEQPDPIGHLTIGLGEGQTDLARRTLYGRRVGNAPVRPLRSGHAFR